MAGLKQTGARLAAPDGLPCAPGARKSLPGAACGRAAAAASVCTGGYCGRGVVRGRVRGVARSETPSAVQIRPAIDGRGGAGGLRRFARRPALVRLPTSRPCPRARARRRPPGPHSQGARKARVRPPRPRPCTGFRGGRHEPRPGVRARRLDGQAGGFCQTSTEALWPRLWHPPSPLSIQNAPVRPTGKK